MNQLRTALIILGNFSGPHVPGSQRVGGRRAAGVEAYTLLRLRKGGEALSLPECVKSIQTAKTTKCHLNRKGMFGLKLLKHVAVNSQAWCLFPFQME